MKLLVKKLRVSRSVTFRGFKQEACVEGVRMIVDKIYRFTPMFV